MVRPSTISAVPVEIIAGGGSDLVELLAHASAALPRGDLQLAAAIAAKEAAIRQIHRSHGAQLEEYAQSCREFELLSLVYKVLCQSDDTVLRKMTPHRRLQRSV